VVRKEIIKLLEAGIIYHIADSKWVSHVHCVPKKGGITIVPNDESELLAQRDITSYRMCIDFRKLERLSKHSHFCYLDGYSGFKFLSINMIKRRLLLHVLSVLLLIEECLLVCVMCLLLFKDA
jgi:hypothetical protein